MLQHKFEKLDAIERVRAALKDVVGEKLTVPGIVVVGAQSSGKSSVLEHATGLAFPRGEGTCTRVPTTVSVECVPDSEATGVTCATDAAYETHRRDLAVDDADGFAAAIRELTDELAPAGAISDRPIFVKYRKHGVGPTFTLTDCPGITCLSKTQLDIEKTTTDLTRSMIAANDETLVLVVLPATEDFQNSKALKIAEQEDPEGLRTIGIVTKIDNLPPGSRIVEHMAGADHPLRHGYYAVRNRTQTEIDGGVTLDALAAAETSLFASHPVLSQLPETQRGMARLQEKICAEQASKVDACIPKLKREISDRLVQQRRELGKLPGALATADERAGFLGAKLAQLAALARRCAAADTTVLGVKQRDTNLSARVHEALKGMTDNVHNLMPDFLSDRTKDVLLEAANEALGYNLSNFMQGDVFRGQFASVAPMLEREAASALDAVQRCTVACLHALVVHVMPCDVVAPKTSKALCALIEDELQARHAAVIGTVEALVRAERGCTYTNNHYLAQTISKFKEIVVKHSGQWKQASSGRYSPSFEGTEGGGDIVPADFLQRTAHTFNTASNEAAAVREMQITLHAYGKVVHKRFTDSVSVLAIDGLVTQLVDDLPSLAVKWTPQLLESLVEDKRVAMRRKELTRSIAGLTEAASVLAQL